MNAVYQVLLTSNFQATRFEVDLRSVLATRLSCDLQRTTQSVSVVYRSIGRSTLYAAQSIDRGIHDQYSFSANLLSL